MQARTRTAAAAAGTGPRSTSSGYLVLASAASSFANCLRAASSAALLCEPALLLLCFLGFEGLFAPPEPLPPEPEPFLDLLEPFFPFLPFLDFGAAASASSAASRLAASAWCFLVAASAASSGAPALVTLEDALAFAPEPPPSPPPPPELEPQPASTPAKAPATRHSAASRKRPAPGRLRRGIIAAIKLPARISALKPQLA